MRVSVVAVVLASLAVSSLAITLTSSEFDVRLVIPGNTYQAITFTPNGDLFMCDPYSPTCCKYANAANLPIGAFLPAPTCGVSNTFVRNWVSSQTGRLYTVNGYEVNSNTLAATQRWKDCGATHGIAIDPRDGAVFVASVDSGKVWRIPNPDTYTGIYNTDCDANLFFDLKAAGHGIFDSITIAPDGTFYGAGWSDNKLIVLSPWSASSPKGTLIAAKPSVNSHPDGISICVGSGNSFAIVSMTTGSISKFNLTGPGGAPTYAESTIATNIGGYLDFTAVDPKGCIWGTTMTLAAGAQGVYRVTNADGTCGCASAQVPTSGGCPNCNQIKTVHYPGNVAFSDSFQSSTGCASVAFN